MKLSVITPTSERPEFLKKTYRLLQQQTYTSWQWLIYDTSLRPLNFSDDRIHYFHDPQIISIGEKRNRLIEHASGDVIVHFDDDDYYAASYLQSVAAVLKSNDFFNLSAWFSYDLKTRQFFYWDTEEQTHTCYHVSSLCGTKVREIEFGRDVGLQQEKINFRGKTGYGFSFAYSKEVGRACTFPDVDFAEDYHFFTGLSTKGYEMSCVKDKTMQAVHVLHDTNTSAEFPQYRIPYFLLESFSTPFLAYLAQNPSDSR